MPEPERNAESEHRMSPGDRMKRGKNLAQRLTLPQEVVSQGPLAELHGNTSVCIENHGGILEYTDARGAAGKALYRPGVEAGHAHRWEKKNKIMGKQ